MAGAEKMNRIKMDYLAAKDVVEGIGRGVPVKPQHTDTKQVPQEKPKAGNRKPDGKKAVVPRRAPSRGKYIDEYARAPF
jgi:hypothetical protein